MVSVTALWIRMRPRDTHHLSFLTGVWVKNEFDVQQCRTIVTWHKIKYEKHLQDLRVELNICKYSLDVLLLVLGEDQGD